ncbi:hypothetical protein TNCV_669141 [Trichonephila clavipes]|nr:hypothetical protein TNCV_669141 [Trichonephila clavipes]
MVLHSTTSTVGVVCRCKAKAGVRHSPRGLHTRTRLSSLLRLNLDSLLKATLDPFCCSPVSSCVAPLQMEALTGGCQGQHTYRAPRSQMSFSQAPSNDSRRHRDP